MVSLRAEFADSRFHYEIPFNTVPDRKAFPIKPSSSTSARGKIVYHRDRLLALLHVNGDLQIWDVYKMAMVGLVKDTGAEHCQEVLFDVSQQVEFD